MAHIIDSVNLKGVTYLVRDASAASKSDVDEKIAEINAHIDSSVANIDASLGRIFSKIAQLDNVMSEDEYNEIENPKNELYFVYED